MKLGHEGILLVWGDARSSRALFKVLGATGANVRMSEGSGVPNLQPETRLVLLDYDTVRERAQEMLNQIDQLPNPPAVLVVTKSGDKGHLTELFSHKALTNAFAKNQEVSASELLVTVQKIMLNDIFGLEKYMTWGMPIFEFDVMSSGEKDRMVGQLESYLQSLGVNSRLVALAKGVADEFIMNAIYNAPVDESGKPKYAHIPRSERVDLDPRETVRFCYACDGQRCAISVSDPFGRLDRDTVFAYLRKCLMRGAAQIDTKDGGAGLGLYYIFESLNQFIINVDRGRRSEMIGILDVSGSYRDFAEQSKSLHIFARR